MTTDDQWRAFIHESFPPMGENKRAHEGSQSNPPVKNGDANQPVDLDRKKTVLPGDEGSTSPGFRGRAPD